VSDDPTSGDVTLLEILEESRSLGFLGPGPVDEHVDHARGFLVALEGLAVPESVVDLGSGGGLPGLVLARALPRSRWLLLDANQRRTAFLERAVAALDLGDRVTVVTGRAEDHGRSAGNRGVVDLVVARSFAAPPVTAECAAPLLRTGGHLLVSEPPADGVANRGGERWPAEGLAVLGMVPDGGVVGPPRVARLRQIGPCPDRYPRRTGVPAKRPLW
jgi:16S rRNA (guanine527-N7)-methyltransferase